MNYTKLFFLMLCVAFVSCTGSNNNPAKYARGADISWLTEQEADDVVFLNEQGEAEELMHLLKSMGMNAVRLRVWVNHSTGWCNKADVIAKAKRAQALQLAVMIDFHYSDNFADPSTQTTPALWADYDIEKLKKAVSRHTIDILKALKDNGVEPLWVQVGNETTHGMLWPTGKLHEGEEGNWRDIEGGWSRYAELTAAGYDAVKTVLPNAIVIVHHDNAYQDHRQFYHNLLDYGGKFDMIGLSHYPMMLEWCGKPWEEMNQLAEDNVRSLAREFGGKVMIAEVGMKAAEEELSAQVMQDFVSRMKRTGVCAGIFYWEPQVFNQWKPREYEQLGWGAYDMGSFTEEGKPNQALKIMLR